jgi:hypothetical protein
MKISSAIASESSSLLAVILRLIAISKVNIKITP